MNPIRLYKEFIDGLLKWPSKSVTAVRLHSEKIPETDPLFQINQQFTPEQRAIIADLLEKERSATIHDFLTYLEPYRLTVNATELAFEPFGTESHFDWAAREAGDVWPDERPVS